MEGVVFFLLPVLEDFVYTDGKFEVFVYFEIPTSCD